MEAVLLLLVVLACRLFLVPVQGSGFRVLNFGFRVLGFGRKNSRIQGQPYFLGFQSLNVLRFYGFRVLGFQGFRVLMF
jgi:hypothetical protein